MFTKATKFAFLSKRGKWVFNFPKGRSSFTDDESFIEEDREKNDFDFPGTVSGEKLAGSGEFLAGKGAWV